MPITRIAARRRTRAGLLALVLACTLLVPAGAATDVTKYHTHAELASALGAAVAAHPDLAKLVSIGKTRGGRDLWAVEIAQPRGVPVDQRPGLLIAANFEADHLIGSEIALAVVEQLLAGYPTDATIKQRLENHVIYVVPRMNPDGAELMFAPVKTGARTNLTPHDADNDARLDEDGPEDLNKDGVITVMRVKDPAGPYMPSPDDPRLMKRADPAKGESGGWALYTEGIDNDGDGFINEDGIGGVDINRNFMHQYPYYAPDAGRHMASEIETRALLDYVLKHRNIAAILTFGASDTLIAAQPRAATISLLDFAVQSTADARKVGTFVEAQAGFGRGGGMFMMGAEDMGFPGGRPAQPQGGGMRTPARNPATTVNAGDVEYIRAIADKYREITGLRSAGLSRTPAGAFFEYGYYQYGVPSFSTPGWALPGGAPPAGPGAGPRSGGAGQPPAGAPAGIGGGMPVGFAGRSTAGAAGRSGDAAAAAGEALDLRLLQWIESEKIDGFAPWTPFTHPTLGAVEIGGFKPYVTVNPPAAKIAELGTAHTKFVLHLTSLFARVRVAKADVTPLATGLYRIHAEIENAGFLPTALAHGVTARAVQPVTVQLGVPPESIVTGADKTITIPSLAGSGGRQGYDWVVTAKPGTTVSVTVLSQKGGRDTATVTLK